MGQQTKQTNQLIRFQQQFLIQKTNKIMSEQKHLLENKLNEYNIVQFTANKIIMQHKKSRIKFIYKEILMTIQNNNLITEFISRVQIQNEHLIKIDYCLGNSIEENQKRIGIFYEYYVSDLQKQLNNRIRMKMSKNNNLKDFIFTEEQLLNTFAPILQSVKILHKFDKCHGFIKSNAILLTESYDPKLCDQFLLCQHFQDKKVSVNTYYAPQNVQKRIINKNGDLWNLGLVILECACLENSENIYDHQKNKIILSQIQKRILTIESFYSEEFIIGIKLLLSLNESIRFHGIDLLLTKKMPQIIEVQSLKPKKIKKEEKINIYQPKKIERSRTPKEYLENSIPQLKNSQIKLNQFDNTNAQGQKKIVLKQSQNKFQEKKHKIEQMKEKFKSKMTEETQLKKKQIQKINKIIQKSHAFVNQLMTNKSERPQDKQKSKMTSLLKTSTLFSKVTQKISNNTIISNIQNKTDKYKEDPSVTMKKKEFVIGKQSPVKQQIDKIFLMDKLKSPIKKK